MALHGLEDHIKKELSKELFQFMKKKRGKASCKEAQRYISIIFYADDFVVIHENEEIIKKTTIIVETWLKTIGLGLKSSKTKISHTIKGDQPGFDFLGFNNRECSINCVKSSL